MAEKRGPKKDALEVTRGEVREIEPLIREAVRREDFEAYMEILTSRLGVKRGSDQCRFFESKFWTAVAEILPTGALGSAHAPLGAGVYFRCSANRCFSMSFSALRSSGLLSRSRNTVSADPL